MPAFIQTQPLFIQSKVYCFHTFLFLLIEEVLLVLRALNVLHPFHTCFICSINDFILNTFC